MTDGQAESLGEFLREKREAKGMSGREAARRADIDEAYLRKLERGANSNPGIEVLQRLAVALDFDLNEAFEVLGVPAESMLPEPRIYFRRKFGVSEDDAELMARLIEKYRHKEVSEDGEDIED